MANDILYFRPLLTEICFFHYSSSLFFFHKKKQNVSPRNFVIIFSINCKTVSKHPHSYFSHILTKLIIVFHHLGDKNADVFRVFGRKMI